MLVVRFGAIAQNIHHIYGRADLRVLLKAYRFPAERGYLFPGQVSLGRLALPL
jgi:hypothetical protein